MNQQINPIQAQAMLESLQGQLASACANIAALFFWQENHCKLAYKSERKRSQMPPELR